jgi:hypothetical protein
LYNRYLDEFEFHFIELEKFKKGIYELDTKLDLWTHFLATAHYRREILLLIDLVHYKFGDILSNFLPKIEQLDDEQVLISCEGILKVKILEKLFDGLDDKDRLSSNSGKLKLKLDF